MPKSKPKTKVGVHKVDPKTGVKVEPTTKATPPSGKPHADHPHKGKGQPGAPK